MAILFFLLSLALGFSTLRLIPLKWYTGEFIAASITIGLFMGSWITFLTVWIFGYSAGPWLALTLLLTGCVASFHYQKSPLVPSTKKLSHAFDSRVWLLTTTISILLFSWLFYSHMLQEKGGAYFSGGSTWGDLALHLSLITRFAQQTDFTWDFPIFTGARLSYPFLIDFLSGMLYRFGLSLPASLSIPGALLTFSIVQLIFFFVVRLSKKTSIAGLTLLLFLGSGGIGGLPYFWQDWQKSGQSLITFLGSLPKQYANLWSDGIYFSNIINDYLLPQRGILFGLALFALNITFLHRAWTKSQHAQLFLLIAAALTGFLPFAHTHTFFVLWGIFGYLTLMQALKHKTVFNPWTNAFLIASIIGAPQIIWQISSNFTESFTRAQFGWMKKADENILAFWLRNMGAPFIFLFTNFWLLKKLLPKQDWHIHFYIPLVILFAVTNLYLFQPHNYDNMKFMIYSYLAICIYMSWTLTIMSKQLVAGKLIATILVIATCSVGALSILRETYISWQFTSVNDRQVAESLKKLTSPDSIILTSDQHNHLIPTLTGRRIIMGYRGWLWTYGLNYAPVEQAVREMLIGSPATPALLQQYHISYVVIGRSERENWRANTNYYDQHASLILQSQDVRVYDVRTLSLQ